MTIDPIEKQLSLRINKPMRKVSIVTISYNSAATIERTIKSVLSQKYDNIEYIIIDGGSTDLTVSIIQKYSSQIAYFVSEKDEGISDAFNKGLRMAGGELITFLNADDWYPDDSSVSTVAENYVDQNTVLCGSINLISPDNLTLKRLDSKPEKLNQGMYIAHPTCFIPATIIRQVGEFDPERKIAMDFDYLSRCKKEGCSFRVIPQVITNMQAGGASFDAKSAAAEELAVKNKYYGYKLTHFIHFSFAVLMSYLRK